MLFYKIKMIYRLLYFWASENSTKLKQVLTLYFSTVGSTILGIGTSVLNTHNLSTLEYGNVRYITNIFTFVSSILLFGYFTSGARLLALSNDNNKRQQINGALLVVLIIALLLCSALMVICFILNKLYGDDSISNLFFASIFISSSPLLISYINTSFQGENRINGISLARILPVASYLVAGFFIYKYVNVTPVLMLLLQNGISVFITILLIISTKPNFINIKESLSLLHNENKIYGIHVYTGSVLAVSFGYLSGITLGLFEQNNESVGFYSLAYTIASPLSMLPSIIGTTYFRKFANQNLIPRKIVLITIFMSLFSLLAFIVLIHPLVSMLYSSEYIVVARIASFLAVGTVLHGMGDMFNRFLGAHGKGKELRNGAVLSGIILLIGNFVFVYYWGVDGAIFTRVLASIVYMLMMIFYYIVRFVRINKMI